MFTLRSIEYCRCDRSGYIPSNSSKRWVKMSIKCYNIKHCSVGSAASISNHLGFALSIFASYNLIIYCYFCSNAKCYRSANPIVYKIPEKVRKVTNKVKEHISNHKTVFFVVVDRPAPPGWVIKQRWSYFPILTKNHPSFWIFAEEAKALAARLSIRSISVIFLIACKEVGDNMSPKNFAPYQHQLFKTLRDDLKDNGNKFR